MGTCVNPGRPYGRPDIMAVLKNKVSGRRTHDEEWNAEVIRNALQHLKCFDVRSINSA